MTRSLPASLLILVLIAQIAVGLFSFPNEARAAVTVTSKGSWGGNDTAYASFPDNDNSVTTSFTPANNSLLVVVLGHFNNGSGSTPDPSTMNVSGGGLTWTRVQSVVSDDEGNYRFYAVVWTAQVTTGSSMSLTVTHFNDPDHRQLVQVFEVTGHNANNPIGATITGKGVGSDAVQLTLPQNPSANSVVFAYTGGVIAGFGAVVATPASAWTELYDNSSNTDDHLQTQIRANSTSNLVNWDDVAGGDGGGHYGVTSVAAAIEIRASGGALGKPPNNLGLIGYWPMNEATSTTAGDFSGNLQTGTLQGNSTWTNGKRGNAVSFDGSDDYISISDTTTLRPSSITISAWFKPSTTLSARTAVVEKWFSGGVWGYGLEAHGGDCGGNNFPYIIFVYRNASSAGDECLSSGVPVVAGTWYHVTVTYDSSNGDAVMYINGVQVATQTPGTGSLHQPTSPLGIGGANDNGTWTHFFPGVIDDVRIYNRALTAPQAAALYANGTAGAVRGNASSKTLTNGTTLQNNLVGHWTFDGGDIRWTGETTGTVNDSSGSGSSGTLTNFTRAVGVGIGKLGQALNFDGINDQVITTDIDATDNASQLTIAAWVRPDTLAVNMQIVGKYNGNNWYFGASNACGGSNDVEFAPEGSVSRGRCSAADILTAGTWTHIVMVYDGTQATDAGKVTFYANGIQVSAATFGSGISATTGSNAASVSIGNTPSPDVFWDGLLDDVRIYNRALTPAEAKQLYRLGVVRVVQ